MVKGQLVKIEYKKRTSWEYGVVIRSFDNLVEVATESGMDILHSFSDGEPSEEEKEWFNQDIKVSELLINGNIVMAKKKLFGGYKFRF